MDDAVELLQYVAYTVAIMSSVMLLVVLVLAREFSFVLTDTIAPPQPGEVGV